LVLRLVDLEQFVGRMLLGRVVNQHIEAAIVIDRAADRCLAECLLADVAPQQQRLAAFGLDQRRSLLSVAGLVQINDGEFRTLARKQHGNRTADAAVAAGNQHDLVGEPAAAALARPGIRIMCDSIPGCCGWCCGGIGCLRGRPRLRVTAGL
jgi:hypothetical protein